MDPRVSRYLRVGVCEQCSTFVCRQSYISSFVLCFSQLANVQVPESANSMLLQAVDLQRCIFVVDEFALVPT